jgi:hypothetical protein
VFDHRIDRDVLGKLKPRRSCSAGAAAARHTPYLLHTTYPLSREAVGAAPPSYFSEIFELKFLAFIGFEVPPTPNNPFDE